MLSWSMFINVFLIHYGQKAHLHVEGVKIVLHIVNYTSIFDSEKEPKNSLFNQIISTSNVNTKMSFVLNLAVPVKLLAT